MSAAARKSRSSEGQVAESVELCKVCGDLEGDDKWVSCDMCSSWVHISCAGLDDADFKYLTKVKKAGKSIHWFCGECNSSTYEVMKTVNDLKDKYSKLEFEMRQMREEFMKSLDSNKREMQMMVNETTQVKQVSSIPDDELFSEVVAKHVDAKLGSVTTDVKNVEEQIRVTRESVAEVQDKENRRNNLIIYRVPESDARTAEERSSEDRNFCMQLVNALNLGLADEDLKKVFRLGRRSDSESAGPRPLLVEVATHWAKNLIMESLYKLKSLDARFKGINVAHDMTIKERDECKKLVAEAKAKSEQSGDFIYRVRGSPGHWTMITIRKHH